MSKKLVLFLLGIFFFSFTRSVFASPIINEIMYDLDGSDIDWVEIYNPDSTDVDLTTLKLLISNSTSNHGIVKNSGSQVLHQGDYGVIAVTSQVSSFVAKWPGVANVFTSSFSLPNDGGKVEINAGDKTAPISSVTYSSAQGATEDGNSLQLINGSWTASVPTPGVVNKISVLDNDSQGDESSNTGDQSDTTVNDTSTENISGNTQGSSGNASAAVQNSSSSPKTYKIKVKIIGKPVAFTTVPFTLQAQATGYSNELLYNGKYYWNFGDGESSELRDSSSFQHTYMYSGDYPVTLEFYSSYYSDVPDAIAKLTIKVVPMAVSISRVGNADDFFIELSNSTNYEIDISKWVLSETGPASLDKKFILPKDTFLLAKKKMTISPKVSGLSFDHSDTLKLVNQDGKIVFDYGATIEPAAATVESTPITTTVQPLDPNAPLVITLEAGSDTVVEDQTISTAPEITPDAALTDSTTTSALATGGPAEAIVSGVDGDATAGHPYIIIFSIIFIGASAGGVYFIRRKKVLPQLGGEYEILDE